MDTLHLRAIADVNAGWADGDALIAGHTVAQARQATVGGWLLPVDGSAFFTPPVVIGHYDGIFIEQHGLKPAIRADEGARLLAETSKDAVEQQ